MKPLSGLAILLAPIVAAVLPPAINLKTEGVSSADYGLLPIDAEAPRFSWDVPLGSTRNQSQSAYTLTLANDGTTVWQSGKVESAKHHLVPYSGPALVADTIYTWSVVYFDASGVAASPATTSFLFGLSEGDWNSSDWVACPHGTGGSRVVPYPPAGQHPYNQLRRDFTVATKITRATVYISGTGYFRLYMNGVDVSGIDALQPGWTDYNQRVLYTAYDVTPFLHQSTGNDTNTMGVRLGNGWPNIDPVPWNGTSKVPPQGAQRKARAVMRAHYADGTVGDLVVTSAGGGWTCGSGALLFDDIYNGVTWNASLDEPAWNSPGFVPAGSDPWLPAIPAYPFASKIVMSAQSYPPVRQITSFSPINITEPLPGVYVFDFGQNLAGWCSLSLKPGVAAGVNVTMKHAEVLMHEPYGPPDGTVYTANLRSAKATDTYLTRGTNASAPEGETWHPMFTYHGFRYVQVYGLPYPPDASTLTAVHVRSAVKQTGNFLPGNDLMAAIQHNVLWVQANNYMSVPTDCDQRDERKGWMGDAGLSVEEGTLNFDSYALYTSFLRSIKDSQENLIDPHATGAVPDTVPHTFGSYPADPEWGTAYPTIVFTQWRLHGDVDLVQSHLPALKLYYTWLNDTAASTGLPTMFSRYGEWVPPPAIPNGPPGQGPKPPGAFISSFALLQDIWMLHSLAAAVGDSTFAAAMSDDFDSWAAAFNSAWLTYNPSNATAIYANVNGDGLQTAQACAYVAGAVGSFASKPGFELEPALMQSLVDDVRTSHDGHLSTGITGVACLFPALTRGGFPDVALNVSLQTTYPGYGFEVVNTLEPATTLWELWNAPYQGGGMNSRAHVMDGSIGAWFYKDVAGLAPGSIPSSLPAVPDGIATNPTVASTDFETITFYPAITSDRRLPYASASLRGGLVATSWVNGTSYAEALQRTVQAYCQNHGLDTASVSALDLLVPADDGTVPILVEGVTPIGTVEDKEEASTLQQHPVFHHASAARKAGVHAGWSQFVRAIAAVQGVDLASAARRAVEQALGGEHMRTELGLALNATVPVGSSGIVVIPVAPAPCGSSDFGSADVVEQGKGSAVALMRGGQVINSGWPVGIAAVELSEVSLRNGASCMQVLEVGVTSGMFEFVVSGV